MTDTKHTLSPRTRAWMLRSVALFAVFCAAWILFGDRLTGALIGSSGATAIGTALNGLLFVAIASWMLWSLVQRAAVGAPGGATALPEHRRAVEAERRRVMFEQSVDGMVVLG